MIPNLYLCCDGWLSTGAFKKQASKFKCSKFEEKQPLHFNRPRNPLSLMNGLGQANVTQRMNDQKAKIASDTFCF